MVFDLASISLGAFTTLSIHEVEKLVRCPPPIALACRRDQSVQITGGFWRQSSGFLEGVQTLLALRDSRRISRGERREQRVDRLNGLFIGPDLRGPRPPDKPTHEQHQSAGRCCDGRSFRCRDVVVGHSVVSCGLRHIAHVHRREGPPGVAVDEGADEPHGTIPKQHIAAAATCMLRVHLVGVSEGIVRCVDDDVRMVVDVGPAVDADDASAAVGVADADGRDLRWNNAPRNDADPGLVAQNRVGVSGEDGLRQAVESK